MKLVIFDMDGTILNTIDDLANSANAALIQHNYKPYTTDRYKYFVGNGIKKLIERTLEEQNGMADFNDVFKSFMENYDKQKTASTAPYPGIVETLKKLEENNIKVAVASNKVHSAIAPLLEYYFSGVKFAAAYGQRDNVPVKPDPTIVYDILKDTGISKEDTLYVGDTGVDMKTGKSAGLKTVGVLWGFRTKEELEENGADYIISEPSQLLDLAINK